MPGCRLAAMCSSDEAGSGTLVAPCRQARVPLSRDRIIDAALTYVDANCLADLSMRRLGGELGVEAMSLYRYFPSKAALLDGVACRLLSDLDLPDTGDGADWEPRARAYARSFRQIARAHPRLFPLLATVGPSNDTLGRITQRMVQLWREAGLGECQAERAQRALQGFVTGSSLWEATSEDNEVPAASARPRFVNDMAAGRPKRAPESDPDADFEFGLDLFLEGLRQRISVEAVPAR
jgi:TetR/AcrR family tetracycline transcriptional repressor